MFFAQTKHDGHGAKPVTVSGELVDLGCYLAHASKGADHKSCAEKCIAGGMPMGVLTADGKLYLLTQNHENADLSNAAKEMAADQVSITGPVHDRDSMKAIEVKEIKKIGAAQKSSKG